MAALGFALLEFFQMLSLRCFSSGDSVRCSALLREPLLRSLLKLKPRDRGRALGDVAESISLVIIDTLMDLGPPLGSPRLAVMAQRLAGNERTRWPVQRVSVERTLGLNER